MFLQSASWSLAGQALCGKGWDRVGCGEQVEPEPWLLSEAVSALSGTTQDH